MIVGLCCVKNCEAWIEQVLATHLRVCDHVLVLDDGSADKTGRIARSFDRVHYRRQDGLPRNEARDRNSLFAEVHDLLPAAGGEPDWCWWFDGDETLWRGERSDIEGIGRPINTLRSFLLDLWGDERHYAADWSHPKRHIFRYLPSVCAGYRWTGRGEHQLHCGACPRTDEHQNPEHVADTPIVELHWGYMTPEMCATRLRQYAQWDPAFNEFKPYRRFEQPPKDVRRLEEYERFTAEDGEKRNGRWNHR